MNSSIKRITGKLPISDRIEKLQEIEAYKAIKDHKENFMPLLKPSKSSTGKLNKVILDKINQQMQLITKVNQWNKTSSVIECFNNFENKE